MWQSLHRQNSIEYIGLKPIRSKPNTVVKHVQSIAAKTQTPGTSTGLKSIGQRPYLSVLMYSRCIQRLIITWMESGHAGISLSEYS